MPGGAPAGALTTEVVPGATGAARLPSWSCGLSASTNPSGPRAALRAHLTRPASHGWPAQPTRGPSTCRRRAPRRRPPASRARSRAAAAAAPARGHRLETGHHAWTQRALGLRAGPDPRRCGRLSCHLHRPGLGLVQREGGSGPDRSLRRGRLGSSHLERTLAPSRRLIGPLTSGARWASGCAGGGLNPATGAAIQRPNSGTPRMTEDLGGRRSAAPRACGWTAARRSLEGSWTSGPTSMRWSWTSPGPANPPTTPPSKRRAAACGRNDSTPPGSCPWSTPGTGSSAGDGSATTTDPTPPWAA